MSIYMVEAKKKRKRKAKPRAGQVISQKVVVNVGNKGYSSRRRTGTQSKRSTQPQVIYQNAPIPLMPDYSSQLNDLRNEVRASRIVSIAQPEQKTNPLAPQPRVPEKVPVKKERKILDEDMSFDVPLEEKRPSTFRKTLDKLRADEDMPFDVPLEEKRPVPSLRKTLDKLRDREEVSGVLEGMMNKVEREERLRLAALHREERKTTTIDEALKNQGPAEEPPEPKKRGRPKMTAEQKEESARKRKEDRLKQPVIGVPITPELEQVAMPKPREFQEGSLLADLEGSQRLPQATTATSRLASRVAGSQRGVSFAEVEGGGGTFSLPEAPAEFPSDEDNEAEYEKYLEAQGRSRSSFVGGQSFSSEGFQDAQGEEPPQGSFI